MSPKRVHVAIVLGTRPEVIKLAPVAAALYAEPDVFRVTVVATGQHRALLDQALAATGLAADVDLDLMRPGQSLSGMLGAALAGLDRVLANLAPDCVLVQGDTTTALAGAVAGFHRRVPVGHVEAGLRTHDMANPFPEEANRRLISGLAAWHFAPTPGAAANLRAEGVSRRTIFVTGNPVVDALRALRQPGFEAAAHGFGLAAGQTRRVLITAHRRESFGRPLREICAAAADLARRFPDVQFVFPVHPNPAVRQAVRGAIRLRPRNLRLSRPLDYELFLNLLATAEVAVTDSGGVQEEAAALGVPSVILRRVTERPEVLQAGGRLVPPVKAAVVQAVSRILRRPWRLRPARCLLGDGRAGERIAQTLAWIYRRRRSKPAAFRI
jgi:UDP-N-acetylglucosamine 2-epimerase (non-hydrolysing)